MRVLIAGIGRFDGTRAVVGDIVHMEQVRVSYQGTATALGGFFAGAQKVGLEVLCTPVARVGPEGAVDPDVYSILQKRIMSELRGWAADVAYLAPWTAGWSTVGTRAFRASPRLTC